MARYTSPIFYVRVRTEDGQEQKFLSDSVKIEVGHLAHSLDPDDPKILFRLVGHLGEEARLSMWDEGAEVLLSEYTPSLPRDEFLAN